MQLRSELVETVIDDPRRGFERISLRCEIRWDPLTGITSRLLPSAGSSAIPPATTDLVGLAESTRPGCPFCADEIEQLTPRFADEMVPGGRFRRGEAWLFPNLLPYSKYSSVCVFSAERHLLPLSEMTPELVSDNLAAQVDFARVAVGMDPESSWTSINANHMPPSGSSVFHPHTQGGAHPFPSNAQRMMLEAAGRFGDYLELEKRAGRRYIGTTGRVEWLAGFAPVGPGEIRFLVPGAASVTQMDRATTAELAATLSRVLNLYADMGFQSYNLALYGAPAGAEGYWLNGRIICRFNVLPLQRSDVTWLERLHWEAATDLCPEDLAAKARTAISGA